MEGKDGTELAGRGFSLNNKYQTLEIQNSAAEQQFRANLCKSDFLRDISHFLEAAATPHVFVYPHFWAKQAISTKIQRQIQMPGNNYKFKHGYTELQSNATLLWCHSFFHIDLKQEQGIIQYKREQRYNANVEIMAKVEIEDNYNFAAFPGFWRRRDSISHAVGSPLVIVGQT